MHLQRLAPSQFETRIMLVFMAGITALVTACGETPSFVETAQGYRVNINVDPNSINQKPSQSSASAIANRGPLSSDGILEVLEELDGGSQEKATDTPSKDSPSEDNNVAEANDEQASDEISSESEVNDVAGVSDERQEESDDTSYASDEKVTELPYMVGYDKAPDEKMQEDKQMEVAESGSEQHQDQQTASEPLGSDASSVISDGGLEEVPSSYLLACAKLYGVDKGDVVGITSQGNQTVAPGSVLAAHVNGNNSKVTITLTGESDMNIAGICIYAAGNQPEVQVNVGVKLGGLFYRGRGNSSKGFIYVRELGSVETLIADLAGNSAMLQVNGPGSYSCEGSIKRNPMAEFSCD